MAPEVCNERAVGVAAPPGPVVDADDPRLGDHRQRHGAHRARAMCRRRLGRRDARRAGRRARCPWRSQGSDAPRPGVGFAAGAAAPPRRRARRGPGDAAGRVAPEATQAQMHLGDATLPGQVAEPAVMAAVHPARRTLALRARSDARLGPGLDDQTIELGSSMLDDQIAGQERRPPCRCASPAVCRLTLHRECGRTVFRSPSRPPGLRGGHPSGGRATIKRPRCGPCGGPCGRGWRCGRCRGSPPRR